MSKKKRKKNHQAQNQAPIVNNNEPEKVEEAGEVAPAEVTEEPVNGATEETKAEATEVFNEEAKAEEADEEVKTEEATAAEDMPEEKPEEKKATKKKRKNDSLIEITKIKVISEETKSEIKKAIDEALDEEVEDITPLENAPIQNAGKISLRQVSSAIFGFFVLVFAVFGIISTVSRVTNYVQSLDDDSALVEAFTKLAAPLAATDASVFENVTAVSEDVLITAACWDVIFNPSENYTAVDGNYTVSFLDIDNRIAGLFGAGLTYSHKTVGDEELAFEYDEESGMYTIPAYPQAPAYIPKLVEYAQTADGYKLRVEYVLPITELISSDVIADKVMIITLKTSGTEYVISSLELGELYTGQEL